MATAGLLTLLMTATALSRVAPQSAAQTESSTTPSSPTSTPSPPTSTSTTTLTSENKDSAVSLATPPETSSPTTSPTIATPTAGTEWKAGDAEPFEGRAADDGQVIPDSEAVASEALPMPAPLTMGGPPMTLSLEDMDYLTILRPPPARPRPGGPANADTNGNKVKTKNKNNNNKNKGKRKPQPSGGRPTRIRGTKPRPSETGAATAASSASTTHTGPPPGPPSGPPSGSPSGPPSASSPHPVYADPYHSYMYEPPHPYGFGYGYSAGYDYARYEDPVMSPEYQQASSYPEEERFRPMMPAVASPMTIMSSPSTPSYAPYQHDYSPHDSYRPPPRPAPRPVPEQMSHHHGGLQGGLQGGPQMDQRPSASGSQHSTVQLTGSIHAGEHHSSHDVNWLNELRTKPFPITGSDAADVPDATPDAPLESSSAPEQSTAKKATLKDILAEDCPGAEELGYCDSPPRYPMQQVSEAIQRCAQLVDLMYVPMPDEQEPDSEQAACPSSRHTLRPGYVRDSGAGGAGGAGGRWLVALQSRAAGLTQKVIVERCTAAGRPCARLADSKCARNLGFRNGARATRCHQRTQLVPLLTWDPETPSACPRVRLARFPSACVCRLT